MLENLEYIPELLEVMLNQGIDAIYEARSALVRSLCLRIL